MYSVNTYAELYVFYTVLDLSLNCTYYVILEGNICTYLFSFTVLRYVYVFFYYLYVYVYSCHFCYRDFVSYMFIYTCESDMYFCKYICRYICIIFTINTYVYLYVYLFYIFFEYVYI